MTNFGMSRQMLLDVLANAHGIEESRKSALLGRFQHLQRLALVEGINPGRGRAAEYNAKQVFTLMIAFQLLQLGMSPERTVKLIKGAAETLWRSAGLLLRSFDGHSASIISIDPAVLTAGDRVATDRAPGTFNAITADGLLPHLAAYLRYGGERMAIINVTGASTCFFSGLIPLGKSEDDASLAREEFFVGLEEWVSAHWPDYLDWQEPDPNGDT